MGHVAVVDLLLKANARVNEDANEVRCIGECPMRVDGSSGFTYILHLVYRRRVLCGVRSTGRAGEPTSVS
jgi:hypothetical protein